MLNKKTIFTGLVLLILLSLTGLALGKDKPRRTIKVKLVADQHYARYEQWQRKAARMLLDIAEEVTRNLQIDFQIVGYEEWKHDPEENLYNLTSEMIREVDIDSADALIGFTYGTCPDENVRAHTDGVTIPYRGMIIKTYPARCRRNLYIPYVMIHEMVHLMGGVHVRERSLMTPVFTDTVSLTIDRLNQNILRHTRDIDFRQGYRSLSRGSLRKLAQNYQLAISQGNNELLTHHELGKMFMAMGNYADAISVLQSIVNFDSTYTDAWINLSTCYSELGRSDRAIELLKGAVATADQRGLIHHRLMELYLTIGDSVNARQEATRSQKQGIVVDSVLLKRLQLPGEDDN